MPHKKMLAMLATTLSLLVLLTVGALPASASQQTGNLARNVSQWKILTSVALPNGGGNFATSHPMMMNGGLMFQFPTASDSSLTGDNSFVNYMLMNYNNDMTGTTITATFRVDTTDGTVFTSRHRDGGCAGGSPTSLRFEFQDTAAGAYVPTDYWWSHEIQLDPIAGTSDVTATAYTSNTTQWSDINGITADAALDAFNSALQNVKQISFSFGGNGCFANGVATTSGSAGFTLKSLTIS